MGKVSVSAIAQDICNHLGVGLEYYADSIVIKSQTQSQQTDIDFLFKVCQEYGFGMKVYKNKIIIFDRAKQDERKVSAVLKWGLFLKVLNCPTMRRVFIPE